MKNVAYIKEKPYLCIVIKEMIAKGIPKTLKRVGKTKNLKPYETRNFVKGLENKDTI